MESHLEIMQKLLNGLYEEVEEKKSIVRKEGRVSQEFCDICDNKQWEIIPLKPNEMKVLDEFYEWAREFEVLSINRAEGYTSLIEIKSKKQIIKGSRISSDEKFYKYSWNVSDTKSKISQEIGKIRGLKTFFRKNTVIFCPHFDQDNKIAIKIKYNPNYVYNLTNVPTVLIGCEECTSLKKHTRCNAVYKDGFLYSFRCSFIDLLVKKRAEQMGLTYETGKRERRIEITSFSPYEIHRKGTYYFRELDTLLFTSRWDSEEVIKILQPSLLVILRERASLPDYLEYDTHVLFNDKDGFLLYDKNREVESEIGIICNAIVNDLNSEMDKLRGNDHDRTIAALSLIGSKMGFISKTEFSQPGIRLDLVWYDRKGNIQVACEVETSSTWKKDLISTWEVEPKLAIIVGFVKTDRVAKNLMSLTLMKYVPHPVLYINKSSNNAFLFNKQTLVHSFKLNTESSEQRVGIKRI